MSVTNMNIGLRLLALAVVWSSGACSETYLDPDVYNSQVYYASGSTTARFCYKITVGGQIQQNTHGSCGSSGFGSGWGSHAEEYDLGSYTSTNSGTLTQSFGGGSSRGCEAATPPNGPRTSTLRLVASSSASEVTVAVTEPTTCSYVVVMTGPASVFTTTLPPTQATTPSCGNPSVVETEASGNTGWTSEEYGGWCTNSCLGTSSGCCGEINDTVCLNNQCVPRCTTNSTDAPTNSPTLAGESVKGEVAATAVRHDDVRFLLVMLALACFSSSY